MSDLLNTFFVQNCLFLNVLKIFVYVMNVFGKFKVFYCIFLNFHMMRALVCAGYGTHVPGLACGVVTYLSHVIREVLSTVVFEVQWSVMCAKTDGRGISCGHHLDTRQPILNDWALRSVKISQCAVTKLRRVKKKKRKLRKPPTHPAEGDSRGDSLASQSWSRASRGEAHMTWRKREPMKASAGTRARAIQRCTRDR